MARFKNSIVWAEIPVSDFDRAKKFYSNLLQEDLFEQQMGPYRMGFLPMEQNEMGVGGAIVQGENYIPSRDGAKVYLNGGDDLTEILNRVENAGGKIIVEKTEIAPDIGYFAMFEDTEGNVVALHSKK
jgi:predicted enzyme related to lactoylglutathione lyase